jgi:hypothetical protein
MNLVYALCCLLATTDAAANSSNPAAGNGRTIEILIVGPKDARLRMDETIRPLLEPDPDLRWASGEQVPTDQPFPEPGRSGSAQIWQIWIDVSTPTRVRVYLPAGASKGATTVRTLNRTGRDDDQSDLLAREAVAQIVKAAVSALRNELEPPTEAVKLPAADGPAATVGQGPAAQERHADAPVRGTYGHDDLFERMPAGAEKATASSPEVPRRRREGAFWLSLGSGMGWGGVPSGGVEWAKDRNAQPINVGAMTATTGSFSLLPELGYMWRDNFSLSVQLRLEFIHQEQIASQALRSGEPENKAWALFLRGLWFFDVSSNGRFQLFAGASAGAGHIRLPVTPRILGYVTDPSSGNKIPDPNLTIVKTDTRSMGIVLVGPNAGLIYHVSRHFGLSFDARALLGFPQLGFAIEGYVSLLFAVGGKARG